MDDIEALAIKGLHQHFAQPALIADYVDAYNTERKRLEEGGERRPRQNTEWRLGEIEREIRRVIDAITQGAPPEQLIPRMRELEAERKMLGERARGCKRSRQRDCPAPEGSRPLQACCDGIGAGVEVRRPDRVRNHPRVGDGNCRPCQPQPSGRRRNQSQR
ncbi:hypothetical protein [Bradyrhizobium acaciae]|uniref:hypothetical protein n=1 Tax=Bradyrhizobium acaciae TaxID=2683706 RepID=UPI001E30907E|nr:hypothetical protein [Bradyrhizobium acaciae]MCC8978312.1 hypothetical protein [Bradyrhizobium acaciae]